MADNLRFSFPQSPVRLGEFSLNCSFFEPQGDDLFAQGSDSNI